MKGFLSLLLFGILWVRSEGQCKGKICFDKGCYFNGTYYQNGDTLLEFCFIMTCNDSVWQYFMINPKCALCSMCDDPHFRSFDNKNFDWHGKCNYSLSQPFCVDKNCSYSPEYAVYGDFAECSYNTKVTCLDCTTHKVDPFTAILLKHNELPDKFEINNNVGATPNEPLTPFDCNTGNYYPILVWKANYSPYYYSSFENCTFILSPNFSLIACQICLFIFTLPTQINRINGLCGYYDGDSNRDFIERDDCGLTPESIPKFASSWTTLQQKDDNKCCPQVESIDPTTGGVDSLVALPTTCDKTLYSSDCETAVRSGFRRCPTSDDIEYSRIRYDCITDCCGDPKNADFWIKNAQKVASLHCDVVNDRNKFQNISTLPTVG